MTGLIDFIVQFGVSASEISQLREIYLYLVLLPVVATVIGICRYIIGIRTINFYVSVFLSFILFEISRRTGEDKIGKGLIYGAVMFFSIFFVSALLYVFLKKLRMHYIPKLSLIIIGSSLLTTFLILFSIIIEKKALLFTSPFTIVVLVAGTEGFMALLAKKNFKYTFWIALETFIISSIAFMIISIKALQDLLVTNPLIILVIILANVSIGRFLGLRITEYWRFRKILLKQDINESDTKNTKK